MESFWGYFGAAPLPVFLDHRAHRSGEAKKLIDKDIKIGLSITNENQLDNISINIYPNPANDFIVIQVNSLVKKSINVELFDITGKIIQKSIIYPGSTITHLDTRSLHNGQYIVRFTSNNKSVVKKVMITKD